MLIALLSTPTEDYIYNNSLSQGIGKHFTLSIKYNKLQHMEIFFCIIFHPYITKHFIATHYCISWHCKTHSTFYLFSKIQRIQILITLLFTPTEQNIYNKSLLLIKALEIHIALYHVSKIKRKQILIALLSRIQNIPLTTTLLL